MKKLLYTRPDDGGVSVVIPAPKTAIERILGPLTELEYEAHVYERSIPPDALKVREIDETDIPSSREFRNAWVDVTPSSQIDIDCERARDLKLKHLRRVRDAKLEKTDVLLVRAIEQDLDTTSLKQERQQLRDITNPLKAVKVSGVLNDEALLQQIKTLAHQLD